MARLPEKAKPRDYSTRGKLIGGAVALLIRLFSLTFRWRLHDPDNISINPPEKPMIWIFWHNRVFTVPVIYKKFLSTRNGAILSSASRDGEIIATTVAKFGCASIRGSSSRRGVSALLGLIDWVKDGYDVAVVPDGPRGPRYRMSPGVVKLSQTTGALILPMRVEYGSKWVFRSWDKFQLPKPFTTVDVYLDPCVAIADGLDEEAFEAERLRLETILNPADETD